MFNKLISNLPFNPSLINQVSFYAKRLKEDAAIRRLGFIFVAMTLALQLFAIFSPAQPTLARAGNDIIPGGFTTLQEAVNHCNNNDYGFRDILLHFGVYCSNLAAARIVNITSTSKDYYSMGRLPQGPTNISTGKSTNESKVVINGVTYYLRKLSSWDSGPSSTYKALAVGNVYAVPFWILFSCGNIVKIGPPAVPTPTPIPVPVPTPRPVPPPKPTPPPPKPVPQKPCAQSKNIHDTLSCLAYAKKARNVTQNIVDANGTTAKPGDVIVYTLLVRNTGRIRHRAFVMSENLTDVLEYADVVNLDDGTISTSHVVSWAPKDIAPHTNYTHTITVKIKNPIPSTPAPCSPQVVHPCPESGSFDLLLTNVFFANTINIKVPPTLTKTTEIITTKTLPATGPGAGIAVVFVIAVGVGYFYARSRILAEELEVIKNEYTSSGGL